MLAAKSRRRHRSFRGGDRRGTRSSGRRTSGTRNAGAPRGAGDFARTAHFGSATRSITWITPFDCVTS